MTALSLFPINANYPGFPAVFSPCRIYRYVLWRPLGDGPYAMFIGLNPSTADESTDDPTIRRCVGFAKREGMGALCMTNVYAYRATDPRVMMNAVAPAGPDNGHWLTECAKSAALVICAWGKHAAPREVGSVLSILRRYNPRIRCLGTNKDGSPKHPLYLSSSSPLLPYGETS